MDEERLIIEVENHRIIYDTTHPFYKDNTKKEKAWKTISEVVGVDAELCKSKWRILRDAFVKNRKKTFASGSAGGTPKEWKYKDIMYFLVPHLQPRSSKSNLSSNPVDEERLSTPLFDESRVTPAPSLSGPSCSGETDRPLRSRSPKQQVTNETLETRRSHRSQASEVEERLLGILQEPHPKPESDLDESYHFAMSLVPLLTKLDHNKRQQAKIGILKLLVSFDSNTARSQPSHFPPQYSRPAPTQPNSNFHPPTPVFYPQQVHPMGQFTQMLASSSNPQWEESTPYADPQI